MEGIWKWNDGKKNLGIEEKKVSGLRERDDYEKLNRWLNEDDESIDLSLKGYGGG